MTRVEFEGGPANGYVAHMVAPGRTLWLVGVKPDTWRYDRIEGARYKCRGTRPKVRVITTSGIVTRADLRKPAHG